jgi:hypothetical protein
VTTPGSNWPPPDPSQPWVVAEDIERWDWWSSATPLLHRQMDATPEPEVWCRHCGGEVIVDNSVGAWIHAWSGLVACRLLDGPTGVG